MEERAIWLFPIIIGSVTFGAHAARGDIFWAIWSLLIIIGSVIMMIRGKL